MIADIPVVPIQLQIKAITGLRQITILEQEVREELIAYFSVTTN
jgi:hypothetical protein